MKKKRAGKNAKKIVLAIYLILCIAFMFHFNTYLEKPGRGRWKQTFRVVDRDRRYNEGEPIVFDPGWLRNYATDLNKFSQSNISETRGDYDVYWLITLNKEKAPSNYKITVKRKAGNIVVMKLKRNDE
jgi:hypothetical protein